MHGACFHIASRCWLIVGLVQGYLTLARAVPPTTYSCAFAHLIRAMLSRRRWATGVWWHETSQAHRKRPVRQRRHTRRRDDCQCSVSKANVPHRRRVSCWHPLIMLYRSSDSAVQSPVIEHPPMPQHSVNARDTHARTHARTHAPVMEFVWFRSFCSVHMLR